MRLSTNVLVLCRPNTYIYPQTTRFLVVRVFDFRCFAFGKVRATVIKGLKEVRLKYDQGDPSPGIHVPR